jgi:hypothetical protein
MMGNLVLIIIIISKITIIYSCSWNTPVLPPYCTVDGGYECHGSDWW